MEGKALTVGRVNHLPMVVMVETPIIMLGVVSEEVQEPTATPAEAEAEEVTPVVQAVTIMIFGAMVEEAVLTTTVITRRMKEGRTTATGK